MTNLILTAVSFIDIFNRIILFNYLAKYGTEAPLKAAMTISVAYNMFESTKSLETPINMFLFNNTLTRGLNQAVRE